MLPGAECIVFVLIVRSVHGDPNFWPINWSLSSDVDHPRGERSYEYPMFTKVAPSPCDLTENSCDAGCCLDPDCSADQKSSFNCSLESERCSGPVSEYDCNCGVSKPFWFPVLCYVFQNPIYLGMFFKTPPKMENLNLFKMETGSKSFGYTNSKWRIIEGKGYVFDSPILSFVLQNGTYYPFPHALLRERDFSEAFLPECRRTIRYMKDRNDSCYVRITKQSCSDGFSLSPGPYLLTKVNHSSLPFILKNMETEEIADVDITFKCSSLNSAEKTIRKKKHKFLFLNRTLGECHNDSINTFWNGSVCRNVLAKAVFDFLVNGTDIVKLNVQLVLGDISLASEQSESVYLNKVHHIKFRSANNEKPGNSSDNYQYNRGYYIGETLNFGYNRTNGSKSSWERGRLQMFVNGYDCDRKGDVRFGYDSYARCHHRINGSDCNLVRNEIKQIFDSLLEGDYLAPYGSYSNPQRAALPLLRNHDSPNVQNETEKCVLPIRQVVQIQYILVVTREGFPVRRAVGLLSERFFGTVTLIDRVMLTSEVAFLQVKAVKDRPLSRFWQKVYSTEESENAWINIFKVFEGPTSEFEEPTVWYLLLLMVSCAIFTLLQQNR